MCTKQETSGMDRLTELLPCPFCGGKAYLSDAEAGTGGLSNRARNPRCWQCGVDLGYCDTAVEAAAAWNRRASQAAPAPSDALREALERLEAKASAVSSAHARKGGIGFAVAEMGPAIIAARAALSASPAQEWDPRVLP